MAPGLLYLPVTQFIERERIMFAWNRVFSRSPYVIRALSIVMLAFAAGGASCGGDEETPVTSLRICVLVLDASGNPVDGNNQPALLTAEWQSSGGHGNGSATVSALSSAGTGCATGRQLFNTYGETFSL